MLKSSNFKWKTAGCKPSKITILDIFLKYFMSHQITKLSEAADLGGRAVVKKDFKK